jgi:dihydrodipicolinate synthase/N-acetylneuraminate lyase
LSVAPRISPRILAPCCLPWTPSYALDEVLFRHTIRDQLAAGFTSLYLFGTAGEGYAVTETQFEQVARIFAEETNGKAEWRQLGIIALSLPQVQERIARAMALGLADFQISFPSWGKLNDREVQRFFEGTCGSYPACRFLFYNVPRGLRLLTAAEVGTLAARYDNLVAVKWAGRWETAQIQAAFEAAPQLCHFFTDISFIRAGLEGLRPGLLMALAAANRRRAHELFHLVNTGGDPERLKSILAELEHHNLILRELPLSGRIDGAYDKMIAKLNRHDFPLRLLPPYEGSTDEVFAVYLERMRRELPGWLESDS